MHFIPAEDALAASTHAFANSDDVLDPSHRAALLRAPAVALHFPKWTDGRAYSQAVLLRGRLRYAGDIVATGDVLADMLPLLRRCGFTAVQMRGDQDMDSALMALNGFDVHYQQSLSERHAVRA
jgi:uncharacterized protein (DUF934 family)